MRVALNGFGRIGKNFLRAFLADTALHKKITIPVINIGPGKRDLVAHLFKYDSLLGTLQAHVRMQEDVLWVNEYPIAIIAEVNADILPWKTYDIDWVLDCSGKFTTREKASLHLKAGARKVLISAPAHGEDVTIIPGVNDAAYDTQKHAIVSLGSCTTNAAVPLLKVVHDTFGFDYGILTTVHAYTNSQALLDVDMHEARRSRAAALNIVPTSTGASEAIAKVLPTLQGKIIGNSLRVPVGKVSLVDLTLYMQERVDTQQINEAFIAASTQGPLSGILGITSEPLVSSDFNGVAYSVTVDASLTQTVGALAKISGWYDNEWAYSVRLKDFLGKIA